MKEITRLMVDEFNLKKLKYDFMGYSFNRTDQLSFHHLLIAHRDCTKLHAPCDGYTRGNGAILRQNTSHDYLHAIEPIDYDMFLAITSEMLDENHKGKLDIENLKKIRDILECFEREHCGDRTKNNRPLIKEEYIKGRILRL